MPITPHIAPRASLRRLPAALIADASASMAQSGRIEALNTAACATIARLAVAAGPNAEPAVAVIAFGRDVATLHVPLQPAAQVAWRDLVADGPNPTGAAFGPTADLFEDPTQIRSRDYRPLLLLVSDGMATDDWREPLARLLSGRAAKARRIALGIGPEADMAMLEAFVEGQAASVFRVEDVGAIAAFFATATQIALSAAGRA